MSGIFKAWGAIEQGKAGYSSYMSQANAQEYNATVADNNARTVLEQTNAKEESQRRQFRALQGEAIAAAGSSGTTLEGSNADVIRQNAINNELDALTIRYEGQVQNRGLMAQAALDRYGAQASRSNAKAALKAGRINAAASILSSVESAYKGGG